MKLSKSLLAVAGAAMLLAALVGSASARNLSVSSNLYRDRFVNMNFAGGFGTIECEVVLEGSFHTRSLTKTVGSLIGYVTAAEIITCNSGGASIDRSSLPWHDRYAGFTGTLPNIVTQTGTFSGAALRLREPTFGITCQVAGAAMNATDRSGAGGVVTEASVSGTAPCSGISHRISGTTTNVDNRAGARLTLTLI